MKKGKKVSGGRYKKSRKKKFFEFPGQIRKIKLGEEKRKTIRARGGNKKTFLLKGKIINVKSENKMVKSEIKNVLETPSNRFLARQNILTKGTIVETDMGKVKITNRPSQDGVINGILIEKTES
ncbi:MAG TPA: 30S ribosomal protein S8e [Bacillota bacterium]|nr:30S ribosomal protein S8e [Bacillota bacterium]